MPRPKPVPDLVRIIRDVRDAQQDYWIERVKAEQLHKLGKLERVNVYSNRWDYHEVTK